MESTAKHDVNHLLTRFCSPVIAPALRRLQHTRDPALCLKSTASSKSAFGSTPETTMKAWLGLEEKEQSYMDLGGSNDAENPLTQAANSVAGAARTASISARRAVGMQVPVEVQTCVEIDQCVGCTRQFFTKSFLGDDAAVLAPSSGEEPAPSRYRAGVASMAWRSTRRFSTNAP